jgi:phage tail protein X
MINSTSRYAQSNIIVSKDLDGNDVRVIVPSKQIAYTFQSTNYQIKQFDRLPDLAYKFFGNPTLWWIIADANPEVMLWDVVLPAGTIIRIPVNS